MFTVHSSGRKLCLFNGSGPSDNPPPSWLPKETPPGDLSAEIARHKTPKLLDFPSKLFSELWQIKGTYQYVEQFNHITILYLSLVTRLPISHYIRSINFSNIVNYFSFNRLAERVTADRTLFMSSWAVHLLLQYWQGRRTRIYWDLDPNSISSKEAETNSSGDDVEVENCTENEGPSISRVVEPHEASSANFNKDHACDGVSLSQSEDPNKELDSSIDQSLAEERCKTPRQTSPSNEKEVIGSVKELWQWCDKNRIPVEFICINECREETKMGEEY